MATRQNLIDTYNSNPTLQSKYTLPQYLALFDFSQTTTPTPTPTTPTPTPVTPGIPNIINQNLNQGGGGEGPPPGPTFNRNDLLGTSDYQGTGPGFFESIMGIPAALMETYQQFSPIGFISRKIEANKVAKQKALDDAFAKAEAERKAKEEIARAEKYGAINYGRGVGGQSYSGDAVGAPGLGFGVGATTGGPVSNRTGRGRQDYDDGGRVYLYNRLK